MEIYIRIPEWAEGATVVMQNVKYIAPPGDYCEIAKSWINGDLVEIHFPVEKIPANFKINQLIIISAFLNNIEISFETLFYVEYILSFN